MPKLSLSLAICDYDHVRDLVTGRVEVEGINLVPSVLTVEEIFYRTFNFEEWDVSEMALGKYCSLRSQGDDRLIGLPIFPSRAFRQSSIYVRKDGPVKKPADLKGKKIGLPEWAQTASIYSRGWLTSTQKIALQDVEWVQGGVNQAGRKEKVKLELPAGVRYRQESERSLTQLLLEDEIQAIFSARPPAPPADRASEIVRLFADFVAVEKDYFLQSRVYPIMHLIVMRRPVFEANRWIATNLIKAFEAAKHNSFERMQDITCSHVPLPWIAERAAEAAQLFGEDFFPYGLEPNRTTLEAFLKFACEHGVCHRALKPEELFPRETLSSFKV